MTSPNPDLGHVRPLPSPLLPFLPANDGGLHARAGDREEALREQLVQAGKPIFGSFVDGRRMGVGRWSGSLSFGNLFGGSDEFFWAMGNTRCEKALVLVAFQMHASRSIFGCTANHFGSFC